MAVDYDPFDTTQIIFMAAIAIINSMGNYSKSSNDAIATASAAVNELAAWELETQEHNNETQNNLISGIDGKDGYALTLASDQYNQAASQASSASQQFNDWINSLQQSISNRASSLSGMYSLTSQIITALASFTNLTQSTLG